MRISASRRQTASVCCALRQVLDELKQRELKNSEKQERMQVKKKTVDLIPDADSNLLQLQVTAACRSAERHTPDTPRLH